jgi:Ca2+-binding EF-hand superfamily protein
MSTDILRERYGRLFNAYDANRDGYIAGEDMSAYAHKLAATRGYAPDAPAMKDLLDELESEWQMVATAADTDHDGRVNRDEFVGFAEAMRATLQYAVNANAPWPLDPWVNRLHKVLDSDGDGRITLEEYRECMTAVGIAGEMDVEGAFNGFDKSEDGYLSRDEFAEVSRQFWLDANPDTPGHRLVGP